MRKDVADALGYKELKKKLQNQIDDEYKKTLNDLEKVKIVVGKGSS